MDLDELKRQVAHTAEEACYTVVGFGLLAVQRVQVMRRDFEQRTADSLGNGRGFALSAAKTVAGAICTATKDVIANGDANPPAHRQESD